MAESRMKVCIGLSNRRREVLRALPTILERTITRRRQVLYVGTRFARYNPIIKSSLYRFDSGVSGTGVYSLRLTFTVRYTRALEMMNDGKTRTFYKWLTEAFEG